ncbi:MAG: PadR family transcriptional regulator [Candidatus Micrarchaeaceae archaeon]
MNTFDFEDKDERWGRGYGRRMMGGMPGMHMHGMRMHGYKSGFGLKYFILAMAKKQPVRGTDIMNSVEAISRGYWRPSPGSVYFELDKLVEDGYLKITESKNDKFYGITDSGEKVLEEISDWFPIERVVEGASKDSSTGTQEIKEKIKEEIEALKNSGTISDKQKEHLKALEELASKL